MFNKKISLNLKIGGGFLLILFFLVLVGAISFLGLRSLVKNNKVAVNALEDSDFITKKLNDHLVWIKGLDDMFLHKKHFEGELDYTKCGFGKWYYNYIKSEEYKNLPFEVRTYLDDMEEPHKHLHNSAKEIIENYHFYDENLPKFLAEKEIDHLNWMNELINSCLNRRHFNAELDYTKCGFGQWYYSFIDSQSYSDLSESQKKIIRDIEDLHKNLHNSGKKILSYQEKGEYNTAMNIYSKETTVIVKELQGNFINFKNGLDNYYNDNVKAKEVLSNKTIKYIDEIKTLFSSYLGYLNEQYKITSTNSKTSERLTLFLILILIIIAVVAGTIFAILITRSITLPLTKISDKIKISSSEIFNASSQLSSSSQQLSSSSVQLSSSSQAISDSSQEIANGSAEQSSSVEETISSVEELTSMVKLNFSNSKEASNLSSKASELSEKGFTEMENMLSSMTEIKKSSDQIKNVIKVIDDIAFQTNILALNAAVEAARAGEAGMGFAVVADEVKNLANKSQEAAKETAEMIETSIDKSQNGFNIASKLLEIFKEILTGVKKANEVINEVGTASGEQEKGLDQVNKAVIQFDKVVQSNAASAEELASSSEELATSSEELVTTADASSESADQLLDQVSILNNIVEQLVLLITGNKIILTETIEKKQKNRKKTKEKIKKEPTVKKTTVEVKKGKQKKRTSPIINKKEISPEQIIPFEEDEEFKELH